MAHKSDTKKPRPPAVEEMTLDQVVEYYDGKGGYFDRSRLKPETLEKRLIERGLALAKNKTDLDRLLQVILRNHECKELVPVIFAQIMPIMKRVEELPISQQRLTKF